MTSLRSLVFEQQIAPIQKENSSFQQNQNPGFFSFSFDSQDIEEELPEKVPLIETLFKPQETSQKESFDEISKEKNPLQELLKQKKFFFVAHSLNSAHGNRISFQDIKPFARQSSIQDFEKQWSEKKRDLTLDYKRKHKSAAKRKKKMRMV